MSSENMLFDAEQAKNEALDLEYQEQQREKSLTAEVDETDEYRERQEDESAHFHEVSDSMRESNANPFG